MAPSAMKAPKDGQRHQADHVQPRLVDTDPFRLFGDFRRQQRVDAVLVCGVHAASPGEAAQQEPHFTSTEVDARQLARSTGETAVLRPLG